MPGYRMQLIDDSGRVARFHAGGDVEKDVRELFVRNIKESMGWRKWTGVEKSILTGIEKSFLELKKESIRAR
jgi:hypothetical protein